MYTGKEVGPAGGIHFPVDDLVFSSNSKKIVTLAADASFRPDLYVTPESMVWEADSGRLQKELLLGRAPLAISSLHCSDTSRLDVLHADACRLDMGAPMGMGGDVPPTADRKAWTLSRWDLETGKVEDVTNVKIPDNLAPKQTPHCCAISADGRWQASGLKQGGIALMNRAKNKEACRLIDAQDPNFVVFSADGQTMLAHVGCLKKSDLGLYEDRWEQRLQIWTVATGRQRTNLSVTWPSTLSHWPDQKKDYALSPDGRWLAAITSEGKKIRLLEVASGTEREWSTTLISNIKKLAWSPDGCLLAGGDENGTVWVWDMVTGLEVRHFARGHLGDVTALAFSPDGLRLASGSSDTTALIWDLCDLSRPKFREKDRSTADALWASLGEQDPDAAIRSIHSLVRMPDVAVPLLRERLLPASFPDTRQVAMLLTQLDDDNIQIRNQAVEQLVKMGERIEPALREALAKKPSLEICRGINKVLDRVLGLSVGASTLRVAQMRACRGVEVLERIGTLASRQTLEEMSRLPKEMILAEEATSALHRMTKSVSGPGS